MFKQFDPRWTLFCVNNVKLNDKVRIIYCVIYKIYTISHVKNTFFER